MRTIIRRLAATIGTALLATVPLITVVGTAPANAITDELTASATGDVYYSTLVYSWQEYRQTFQATVTGELTRTRVWLTPQYTGNAVPASVSVYNLNADNSLGALVDSASATITDVSWPGPTTDLATFTGGQTLTAGHNYAVVIRSQYAGVAGFGFYAQLVGGYSLGRGYVCTAGAEDCTTNSLSAWFQVYVSTVVPDTTPPVVDLSIMPNPVPRGHEATATFNATDDESDITATTCEPNFTVDTSTVGTFTITCGATSAGGTSEASYIFEVIDATPPVVDLSVAPDPVLQGLTATATFSALDAESDITDTTCQPSFAVDSTVAGEHTITCKATSAGGTSEAAYTYTVLSPAQGIATLEDEVVASVSAKTASSLVSLLNRATKSLSKDDPSGAIDKLNSFIAQVDAQAGKKIPVDVAAELVSHAEMLIASIEASSS